MSTGCKILQLDLIVRYFAVYVYNARLALLAPSLPGHRLRFVVIGSHGVWQTYRYLSAVFFSKTPTSSKVSRFSKRYLTETEKRAIHTSDLQETNMNAVRHRAASTIIPKLQP